MPLSSLRILSLRISLPFPAFPSSVFFPIYPGISCCPLIAQSAFFVCLVCSMFYHSALPLIVRAHHCSSENINEAPPSECAILILQQYFVNLAIHFLSSLLSLTPMPSSTHTTCQAWKRENHMELALYLDPSLEHKEGVGSWQESHKVISASCCILCYRNLILNKQCSKFFCNRKKNFLCK